MDNLLDDDKDLFGDIKSSDKETTTLVAPVRKEKLEEKEAKKAKSGGGLFDDLPLDDEEDEPVAKRDGQASNVNGYKGTHVLPLLRGKLLAMVWVVNKKS